MRHDRRPSARRRRLARALAADLDRAFEGLVLAHQDRLYTIAHRIGGDRRDAEELVQDCFVRAYRALASYEASRIRELRVRGWLTTILINAGRNRARTRRVATTELTWEPGAEPATDPLSRREERDLWARLLAGLSPARAAPSSCAMSTGCRTPRLPKRWDGPKAPSRLTSTAALPP